MPISVFNNENGSLKNATAEYGLQDSNGWWNTVEIADLGRHSHFCLEGVSGLISWC